MQAAFTTRQLLSEDWRIYSGLRLQALTECPGFFGASLAEESKYTEEEWRSWLENKNNAIFGLFEHERIIGITGVVTDRNNGGFGIMIASYIKPDYRGRGLSDLLYRARIDWAKANGAWKKLIIGHREDNEISRRANQRHGFTYTHRASLAWPDGRQADNLYYELDLEQLRKI